LTEPIPIGTLSEVEIERTLIQLRASGSIQGIPDPVLEIILAKARKDLIAGKDERPGPPVPE